MVLTQALGEHAARVGHGGAEFLDVSLAFAPRCPEIGKAGLAAIGELILLLGEALIETAHSVLNA
jgi:hypothetical protein